MDMEKKRDEEKKCAKGGRGRGEEGRVTKIFPRKTIFYFFLSRAQSWLLDFAIIKISV